MPRERRYPWAVTLRLLGALLIATAVVTAPSASHAQPRRELPRAVERVDLKRYAGLWYEVARLPNAQEKHCVGDVTLRYMMRDAGHLDVVTSCRTSDGKVRETRGVGRTPGGTSSGRLEIRYAPAFFSFIPSVWKDHWILGLGPDYTWTVVGMPSRDRLWILSRLPEMSRLSYQQALEVADGNGFDIRQLVKTPTGQVTPVPPSPQ
jgi:apolipoprotein D and lipocalin family protein